MIERKVGNWSAILFLPRDVSMEFSQANGYYSGESYNSLQWDSATIMNQALLQRIGFQLLFFLSYHHKCFSGNLIWRVVHYSTHEIYRCTIPKVINCQGFTIGKRESTNKSITTFKFSKNKMINVFHLIHTYSCASHVHRKGTYSTRCKLIIARHAWKLWFHKSW